MSRSQTLTYWSQGSGNSRRAVKTGTRWCEASVLNTRRVPVRVCACVMYTRLEWSSFTNVPTWRASQIENLVSFANNCPSITWKNWLLTEREMIYHQPLLNNYNWKETFLTWIWNVHPNIILHLPWFENAIFSRVAVCLLFKSRSLPRPFKWK